MPPDEFILIFDKFRKVIHSTAFDSFLQAKQNFAAFDVVFTKLEVKD